eukprot:gene19927-biopygen16084
MVLGRPHWPSKIHITEQSRDKRTQSRSLPGGNAPPQGCEQTVLFVLGVQEETAEDASGTRPGRVRFFKCYRVGRVRDASGTHPQPFLPEKKRLENSAGS